MVTDTSNRQFMENETQVQIQRNQSQREMNNYLIAKPKKNGKAIIERLIAPEYLH